MVDWNDDWPVSAYRVFFQCKSERNWSIYRRSTNQDCQISLNEVSPPFLGMIHACEWIQQSYAITDGTRHGEYIGGRCGNLLMTRFVSFVAAQIISSACVDL